jgi:hypothetical protein
MRKINIMEFLSFSFPKKQILWYLLVAKVTDKTSHCVLTLSKLVVFSLWFPAELLAVGLKTGPHHAARTNY